MAHDLDYIAVHNKLGEGIISNEKKLMWVDIKTNESFEYLFLEDKTMKYKNPFQATFAFLNTDSYSLFSDDGVYINSEKKFKKLFNVNLKKGNRSNDGRVDFNGNLWASSMKENFKNEGQIIYFQNNKQYEFLNGISIPNSLCFDKKRNKGYFSDSLLKKIYRFDMNSKKINEFYNLKEGEPDGAILDEDGNMHVCIWGKGQIYVISPKGKLIEKISVQENFPTCLAAFSSYNKQYLAVTSASEDLQKGKLLVIESEYNFHKEYIYEN